MKKTFLVVVLIFCMTGCSSIKISNQINHKIYWDGNYVFDEIIGHSYYYEFDNSSYKILVKENYSGELCEQIIEQGKYTIKQNTMKLNPMVKLFTNLGQTGETELVVPYILGEKENSFLVSKDTLSIKKISEYNFEVKHININSNNGYIQLQDSSKIFSVFNELKRK